MADEGGAGAAVLAGEGGEQQGGEAEGGEQTPTPTWLEGVDDSGVGFVELKGWKGVAPLLDSYRALETLHGAPAEQLVHIPQDLEDSEAWNQMYSKLGRPDSVEGYSFSGPEVPEGVYDLTPDFKQAALEAGLRDRQAEHIVKMYNAKVAEVTTKAMEESTAAGEAAVESLRREWGTEFQQNMEIGNKFAVQMGWDKPKLTALEAALGTDDFLRTLAKLGRAIGEHQFVVPDSDGLDQGFGKGTPRAAAAQLEQLRLDKTHMDAYLDGRHPGHQAAVNRERKLWEQAHPTDTEGPGEIRLPEPRG